MVFLFRLICLAVEFALKNEYSGSRDLRIAILKGFEREPYHEIVGPVKKRGGPARVDMTFSVTNSYLSTVAGLAFDAGLIPDVTHTVKDYVCDGTFSGEHNGRITWEHLLNQSSDWYGSLFGMYDWADRPPAEGGIDDWRARELHEPGTHYKYNDVRVNVDGRKVQSVSGGGHSGGGMFINTCDHARFGLLFLAGVNGKMSKSSAGNGSIWRPVLLRPMKATGSCGGWNPPNEPNS